VTVFGRDRHAQVDVLTEHPSCSGIHAATLVQLVPPAAWVKEKALEQPSRGDHGTDRADEHPSDEGDDQWDVEVTLVDTASTNGTWVNGVRVGAWERVALLPGDVLHFGHSTRRYLVFRAPVGPGSTASLGIPR
jgi:hypothetical protein